MVVICFQKTDVHVYELKLKLVPLLVFLLQHNKKMF